MTTSMPEMVMEDEPKTKEAPELIKELKGKAIDVLESALDIPLEAFTIGGSGNFPYYWENPNNLKFHKKTYDWIRANLKEKTSPVQQDQSFTNIYIDVLSKITYSLSKEDQQKLDDIHRAITDEQAAVLSAWKDAFGSIPSETGKQPIDLICEKIQSEWTVDKKTTLFDMQNAVDLNELLSNAPASGKKVIPVFADWLNAIGDGISLENNVTMNTGYLRKARTAAQSPKVENGGLEADDNTLVLAYQISETRQQIEASLAPDSKVELAVNVKRSTEDELKVTIKGGVSFTIPVLDLFTIDVKGNANYFKDNIATTENETGISMIFNGVTVIHFKPVDFEMSTNKNWFWMKPIKDAIDNGNKDVSGFKFSPKPQVEFSRQGPFAYLQGVVISKYPSMVITVKSENYQKIQETFEQSASVGIKFLGIPLGINGDESSYSNKVESNSTKKTVTITLDPPKAAGSSVDSLGWVLGVSPVYPAA